MSTANELYAMTPEEVSFDLSMLTGCYYNHLQEFNEYDTYLGNEEQTRVQIKTLKYFNFDGRRFWNLATVWFDEKPVMIIQNAGREGDDHAKRFITNVETFMDMGAFIKSMVLIEIGLPEKIDADADIEELTRFYGNSLNGAFQRY
jgi:hypothetical protein